MALWKRVNNRIQREKNSRVARKVRKQLKTSGFSVISQNCIGGVFYSDMQMEFLSPTINLFFPTTDFLRFAGNLEDYLTKDLVIEMGEAYPLGHLGDVLIHFMHYASCEEAKKKWEERKKRINWQKIVVFCTDTEGFTDTDLLLWNAIKYPRVLFTANEQYKTIEGTVFYPQYVKNGKVPDLIPKREFYKDGVIVKVINKA